jgi:hypothetical protein
MNKIPFNAETQRARRSAERWICNQRSAACLKPQQNRWQMEVGVIERSSGRAPAAGWDNPRSVMVPAEAALCFCVSEANLFQNRS